jgi:hypothetical protein
MSSFLLQPIQVHFSVRLTNFISAAVILVSLTILKKELQKLRFSGSVTSRDEIVSCY